MTKGVGIQGKHAAVNFNVAISDEGREAIACALVRLLRTINKTKLQNFIKGHQQIIIKPIKIKGKVGWDSTIPILTKFDQHDEEVPCPSDLQLKRVALGNNTAFFKCPTCSSPESSATKSFQFYDLDTKQKCFSCGKSNAVKIWKCECDIRWHICRKHMLARAFDDRPLQQRNPTINQTHFDTSPSAKRIKAQMVTESLVITSAGVINLMNPRKRERPGNESSNKRSKGKATSSTLDQIVTDESKAAEKRKRGTDNHDDGLIHLGESIHHKKVKHLLRPALKKRFYGP